MKPLSEYNPFDPAVVADPYEFYAALREQAPVYEVPGLGLFMVSCYDDILRVIRDAELFSSKSGPSALPPPAEAVEVMKQGYPIVDTLLTQDPPEHRRYRALVGGAFSAGRVSKLSDVMVRLANQLVDGFATEGRVELIGRFASPFPLSMIADQLGVPRSDMDRFKKWSDDAVAPLGGMLTPERTVECARSIVEFHHYFAERIEEVRHQPRDDMLSQIVHARLDGVQPLEVPEILSILQQLLVAGNETSTAAIAKTLQLLLLHPDQLEKVRADRSLIPNLVEEVLRYEAPVQAMFRMTTRDTEIRGVAIPSGSRIAVIYGSGNRDAEQFPNPDRFDVTRENARTHLSFGNGEHFCIGAGLARAEIAVAVDTLLSRLGSPRLSAENDFAHHPSFILRGLVALHLEFDAGMESH